MRCNLTPAKHFLKQLRCLLTPVCHILRRLSFLLTPVSYFIEEVRYILTSVRLHFKVDEIPLKTRMIDSKASDLNFNNRERLLCK